MADSPTLRSICVYCGSSEGSDPRYGEAADEMGRAIAEAGLRLVYGGGSLGLMGRVAHAAMAAGGTVTGIIPEFLHEREVMLREVSDLVVTDDMHERKRIMFERSDAFIALPGGIGTLEEVIEMMTWSQLGRHDKPIALINVANFWDPLDDLLRHMLASGFIRNASDVEYDVLPSVADAIPALTRRHGELAALRTPRKTLLDRL
ncbi:MAG: TIGR00730 family Rossman fold protein [Pseudomonadota bacterium]